MTTTVKSSANASARGASDPADHGEGGQQHRHRPGAGAQVVNLPGGHVDEVPGEPVGVRRGPLNHENAGGGS